MSVELKEHAKVFALRVIKSCEALPNSRSGRVIGDQLLRSATSVAANYRAACRGRSKAEFIAKLGVVEEEVDESGFWLDLVVESGLQPRTRVAELRDECEQLTRIMAAARIKAKLRTQKA